MYTILTFSYLILPLVFLLQKNKRKELVLILLAVYGIFAFSFLRLDITKLPLILRAAYALSYTVIEYLFFASFFYLSIPSTKIKRLILFLSAGFVVFAVLFFYSLRNNPFRLDTIPIGVETILLFIYIFIYIYDSLQNAKQTDIYNNFGFWIAVGILLYLGVSFFLYILANDMAQEEIDLYWPVTYVAETIKNLVFCVAIFKYGSKPNDSKKKLTPSHDSVPHLI